MSNHAMRPRRILAGVLAGALAISVSPLLGFTGVASAQTEADPLGAGNFCEDVPQTEPFSDIAATDPAFGHIVCLVATGITQGFPDGTYRPLAFTQRRQMALFLTRLADEADRLEVGDSIEELPAPIAPAFSDVAGESQEVKDAVSQLDQADIAGGFPDGTYRPGTSVSRRQMATFIYNLYEFLTGAPLPAATEDHFPDDSTDDAEQQARTNAVAEAGIFIGNPDGTFAPATPINRRGMARVMTRTLQVLFEDGEITKWVEAPTPGGADIANDKVGVQMLEFDNNGTGLKSVIATFSGLDNATEYHVALFENVDGTEGEIPTVVNTNGTYTFRDKQENWNDPFDSIADYQCTSYNGAQITSIDGVPVNNQCEYDVLPEEGELEVRVENSANNSDAVWLVVWIDADNDDELDLAADNTPSETFGIAGPLVFHGGEAPSGSTDLNGEYILYVDAATKSFVSSDTWLYFWDANDLYNYDEEYNITQADFEAWFNANDYLYNEDVDGNTIGYSRNRAVVNEFSLYDEGSLDPTGATATAGDFDTSPSDVALNDVRVTWTAPLKGNLQEDDDQNAGYCVYRYAAAAITAGSVDSDCFYYSDNTAASDAVIANRTATITDVPAGSWVFTVSADTADGYESDESEPTSAVTAEQASGAPKSTATTSGDTDLSGTITTGDVLTVTFDQDMHTTAAGDAVTLRDGDGTVCSLAHTGNATFAYSDVTAVPGEETLTITLTGAPNCTSAGTIGGLQYGSTVTGSAGIVDQDQSLAWNITGSTDVLFE